MTVLRGRRRGRRRNLLGGKLPGETIYRFGGGEVQGQSQGQEYNIWEEISERVVSIEERDGKMCGKKVCREGCRKE